MGDPQQQRQQAPEKGHDRRPSDAAGQPAGAAPLADARPALLQSMELSGQTEQDVFEQPLPPGDGDAARAQSDELRARGAPDDASAPERDSGGARDEAPGEAGEGSPAPAAGARSEVPAGGAGGATAFEGGEGVTGAAASPSGDGGEAGAAGGPPVPTGQGATGAQQSASDPGGAGGVAAGAGGPGGVGAGMGRVRDRAGEAGGLDTAALGASAQRPEMIAAQARFEGAVADVRARVSAAVEEEQVRIRERADALHAEIDAAADAMRAETALAFEQTRAAIAERAAACRETLGAERDARKAELAERNAAERDRVTQTAAEHRAEIEALTADLEAAARAHGAARAAELTSHAGTRGSMLVNGSAQVAAQYAEHDRANDIRVTVTRMGQEGSGSLTAGVSEEAQALTDDGVALADKLRSDGATHTENLAVGEDLGQVFADLLAEAEAEVDRRYTEAVARVDDAEAGALAEVDALAAGVDGQLEAVIAGQHAGVDVAAEQALAGVEQAGASALDVLDEEVSAVEAWLAAAHPSQWVEVSRRLVAIAEGLEANSEATIAELRGLGERAAAAIDEAGRGTIEALATIAPDLQAQLDDVVAEVDVSLGEAEAGFAEAAATAVADFSAGWVAEADERVSELTGARDDARDDLQSTHDQGIAQIDEKFGQALSGLDQKADELVGAMQGKARDIAEASWLDRALSAIGNFLLGLVDSVVGFLKAVLIVALIVLAVVVVVAVVILLVGGVAALGAAAAAVASFIAGIASALAVIGTVLMVVGIAFALISIVAAWMNPELTWEEKWRSTGKGVGDIALEFLPDFGMSLLTRGDDVVDAAHLVTQVDHFDDVARMMDDPAAAADSLRTLDGADELADLNRASDGLSDALEDAGRLSDEADELARQADDLPVDAPRTTDGPPRTVDGPSDARGGADTDSLPSHGSRPEPEGAQHAPTPEGPQQAPKSGAPDADAAPSTDASHQPEEFVDLTDDKARQHILDGDATGGGHRAGSGTPGKTEFPEDWSDAETLHHISDVATDPNALPGPNNSPNLYNRLGQPNRHTYTAIKNGVEIKVVYEPATGRIVTAYPVRVVDPVTGALVPAPTNPLPASVVDDLLSDPVAPPASVVDEALPGPAPPASVADDIAPSPSPDAPGPLAGVIEPSPPGSPGPRTDGGLVDELTAGARQYDPATAPEWLQRYRERARLEAEAKGITRPRLEAAYDIFKKVAVSLYLSLTGVPSTVENIEVIADPWLDDNAAKAAAMEEEVDDGS